MPYIKPEIRKEIDKEIDNLIDILPETSGKDVDDGTVNYVISRIIGSFYNKPSYKIMNRGIGVLENVKLEFFRRCVAPHEEFKRHVNKDVPEYA